MTAAARRVTRRRFLGGVGSAGLLTASGAFGQRPGDPTLLTIAEASPRIRSGELSAVDLTRAYLARIEAIEPRVNAYITVTAELALEQARERQRDIDAGRWRGPLHGVPVALKDNMDTAGIPTTAASELFADRVPESDAEVYRRLKDAGAILLGKLNLHEFAYGGTSAITHFGAVRNPWNTAHIPGGSSGGSAAAVAARLCAAALGTDTLASIRLPAAYCGITGFKPTHGLSSIRGIIPVSTSLDHVGPMTRTAADAALVLQAIAGYDPLDPVSIDVEMPRFASALRRPTHRYRLGIVREPFYDDLHADVAAAMEDARGVLERLSAGIGAVTLPPQPEFPVFLAEAHAWHAQYLADADNHERYDPITLERLRAAGGFTTDQYVEARRELVLARRAVARVFDEVDLLITPTAPGLPERIDNAVNPDMPAGAEPSIRNTAPFNVFGLPTISVPCGFSRSGLPIGLQITGARLGDADVLALAHGYQQQTDWHDREAPV